MNIELKGFQSTAVDELLKYVRRARRDAAAGGQQREAGRRGQRTQAGSQRRRGGRRHGHRLHFSCFRIHEYSPNLSSWSAICRRVSISVTGSWLAATTWMQTRSLWPKSIS